MTEPKAQPEPRKVFIKTYGCQMNVYDSERMVDALAPHGYTPTDSAEAADLVLLNTCHIREKASEKVFSELGRLREMRDLRREQGRGELMIGVAGCVAQAEGDEIVRRQPAVDLVVGPQSYHRLPDLIARSRSGESARDLVETEFALAEKFANLPRASREVTRSRGLTAFLTVQEGCDKFCTFCVVPYTRGAEVSRPLEAVLAEARDLADAGVVELTLLGQNVNAWHGVDAAGRELGLGELLYRLAEVPGLRRLRYTTSHPRDMDDALIAAHRDLPALMPYLHLPVQSGADRILKAMNRRHTSADYLRLIERIRGVRPDMALSGDFIVGFPGETDEDFDATLALVREVGYASAYTFKYSPRPGTPGAGYDAQVAEDVKVERLSRLNALIAAQSRAFALSCVGTTLDVLLEKPGRMPGQIGGRSPYLQAVHLEAPPDLIGTIQPIEIVSAGVNSLTGRLAAHSHRDQIVIATEHKGASVVVSVQAAGSAQGTLSA